MPVEHLFDTKDFTNLDVESLRPGDIIIHEQEIQERIHELALEIGERYRGKNLLMVGLLKGATFFTVAMMTELHKLGIDDVEMDFMKVSSYGEGTESTGKLRIDSDISANPEGREILLVDDIADTLLTFSGIANHFQPKGVASFATLSLLEKPSRHEVDFPLDYVGFKIPNVWVEGFGMDSGQLGRGNPNIVKGPTRPPVVR